MFTRVLGLLALSFPVCAAQLPLNLAYSVNGRAAYSESQDILSNFKLFTPLESMSNVKDSEFSTLSHPFFPKYSVRIKKTDFCDPTVNGYTGYIDIEARHLFFYFFESRKKNGSDSDDVIFWTNGGPGCSSSTGLFMELGPCRVLDEDGPKFHPESWNTNANVFFIDQPIGVGFSYAEFGESVSTTEEAAQDIAAFVAIFFENFTKFKGKAFHMAGESYGGRYLPLFASAIYDQNAALVEAGMTPINLSSLIIGNGMTDWETMIISYFDMACTPASVPPILDISSCVAMKNIIPRCQKWIRESCVDQFDMINCAATASVCSQRLYAPIIASGMNPYDISIPCNGSVETQSCYPVQIAISNFLSRPSVRSKLGVDSATPANFSSCNDDVSMAFGRTLDMMHSSKDYVVALLERGVRVLIYVGTYDWICNWVGNERWTKALEWSGQAEFASQELREWKIGDARAGVTRSAKGGLFTFATIEGAGHMVPYDKPKQALAMVQRWIAAEPL